MTAPATIRPAFVEPDEPIYPVTYGDRPPCATCYRQADDLAYTADPRGGDPLRVCGPCATALATGRPLPLPTGDELAEVWRTLARLHHNGEIDELMVGEALGVLAWWLPPQTGWRRFEALQDALLRLQAAEDPATVLDAEATGPDLDAETYAIRCQGLVDDALAALMGVRR